jgi:RNA polymerase sigma factor (sigma-70 family)
MRLRDRARDDQFRTYVLQSRASLVRTASLLTCGDADQAEDLVQTVLLRMYLSWPKIRIASRDAYARKMLVTAHLDEVRRPYARKEQNRADVPDRAVEWTNPDSTEGAVFRALAELPPRMRAAVILRHVYDASVAETAQVLGCTTPVRLVAYDGEQLNGFVVDQVPDGWQLQGSNAFRLTIAPLGDTTSPDSFIGKLVVMLLSSSVHQKLPEGEPVQVGGENGVVTHGNEADTLTYDDGAGHLVQVQAWRSALGWSHEQLARFAEGVQVTADAQAGVG